MTVMTKARAREIAQAWLHEGHLDTDDVVLLDDATRTVDLGWVFFYQSASFVETGDFAAAIVGGAPLVVDRDGHVIVTGTARPVDDYLDDLRRSFDDRSRPRVRASRPRGDAARHRS